MSDSELLTLALETNMNFEIVKLCHDNLPAEHQTVIMVVIELLIARHKEEYFRLFNGVQTGKSAPAGSYDLIGA